MDMFFVMAEQKIREAILQGELKDLPGQGKPLQLDDLSRIPEDLRGSYIILKNGGVLPEEMELHKDIITLRSLLNTCYDQAEELALKKKLSEKMLRYDMMMEKRKSVSNPTLISYQNKITKKLGKY